MAELSCRHQAAESAVPAGGRAALRSGGAGRALWFSPCRGARPRNRQRPGPQGPGPETSTELACVHTSLPKLSRPWKPGGRVRLCIAERNRQVGVYFQKTPGWSRKRPASLCPRGPGWRKSHRAGAASSRAGPHFQRQSLNSPKQRAQRSVKLYKNLNASVAEAGVGRSRGLAAGR